MKKMLVFMMVLAVASAAYAGTITVTATPDKAEYNYGEAITIELITSGCGYPGPFAGELSSMIIEGITDTGGGSADAVGNLHVNFDVVNVNGDLVNAGGVLIDDITGAGDLDPGPIPNGVSAYTFDFTTGSSDGTFAIDLSGITVNDCFGGGTTTLSVVPLGYTVVPEPMTIALLGLGGLFLRRRR